MADAPDDSMSGLKGKGKEWEAAEYIPGGQK